MIKYKCERCDEKIKVEDSVGGTESPCPTCQHVQTVPDAKIVPEKESLFSKTEKRYKELFVSWVGGLMIVFGVIVACYFFLFFDTSVAVDNGGAFGVDRVHNLGLLSQRQNGILFGFGIAIVGGVIEFLARSRK